MHFRCALSFVPPSPAPLRSERAFHILSAGAKKCLLGLVKQTFCLSLGTFLSTTGPKVIKESYFTNLIIHICTGKHFVLLKFTPATGKLMVLTKLKINNTSRDLQGVRRSTVILTPPYLWHGLTDQAHILGDQSRRG